MKILNVNATLDSIGGGGTAERTFQMSRFLVRNGIECTVLSTDLGWTAARAQCFAGIRVIALPCVWKRFYIPAIWFRSIRDAVAQADVIHLMGHWTIINACAYLFARYCRKPYVVCPAGSLLIYGRSKLLKRLYNFVIGKRIVRNASGHIAITAHEIAHFETYGVAAEKVTIIPNGIDEDGYAARDGTAFRAQYGLGEHPFIFFVGRLNPIKGPDLLLRAFGELGNQFRNYHLVLAGPDEGMLHELRLTAAKFSIQDRVHFVGYLRGDDKVRAYRAAELVVVPSRQEAMSIVVLEAGITGKPVLLTDQCGFDGITRINGGRVVPVSVEGLKLGIVAMLDDPESLKVMGRNLQKFVRERFDWKAIVNEYLVLYQKILENSNAKECFTGLEM
jgi:glycosyltransferase involved in cell wall biosynthesis